MNGKIIKKIRKMKGFTQKEIYSGVASKSFYSDFEAEKYSIEVSKFEGFLANLGISYEEYTYFKYETIGNSVKTLEKQMDEFYSLGKFEELYKLYEQNYQNENKEIRYIAINAYLLVLLTNANFYQFSRRPFNEIIAELENTKMWTLKEIKLAKLVLLSFSEKEQKKAEIIFQRIFSELEKYQVFDSKKYYTEIGDLFFNRIQALLIVHDIAFAQKELASYYDSISMSDDVGLLIQKEFITYLVELYIDYPETEKKLFSNFLVSLDAVHTTEVRFYHIIAQIHQDKAKNYYERYRKSKKFTIS